ncbi:MAG: NERD domain-containing protein [Chloroflexi bacterium]|nr:NERD domain-containing protein [Chloroflexota bacterium]
MARVVKAAEFATEGEERAAELLRGLPNDWLVICNKTLVTRNARTFEIDFIVVGQNAVFAIDEKSWRGRIHGTDQVWVRDDGSSERSPLGKIEYVAKVLAGELRQRVSRLLEVSDHFVHGAVLLSLSEAAPRVRDPRAADGVLLLATAVERLVQLDARAAHASIGRFRSGIEQTLMDLRDRPRFPKRIQQYRIDEIVGQRPGMYSARATHDISGPRLLFVYNLAGASPEDRAFHLRELEAVQRLNATGLTPEIRDPFEWSDDFLVVPFALSPGQSLGVLKRPTGADDLPGELALAEKAFRGLDTLHSRGIVHRALSPDTVFAQMVKGEPEDVTFTGFYAARVEGPHSIAAQLDDLKIEAPYAAPELGLSYGLADADSDVYSLGLVLLERLTGAGPAELQGSMASETMTDLLVARWAQLPDHILDGLSRLFTRILAPGRMATGDDPAKRRPSADECSRELERLLRELRRTLRGQAVNETGLLDGRYKIVRMLGQGTSGRTYLVEDQQIEPTLPRTFVVKVFHHPDLALDQAQHEFVALQRLQSPHVPRIYDFYGPDHDAHLKMDYVSGTTLADVAVELPWDEARWKRFADALLDALEALERANIRHRDIKPANIILRDGTNLPVLVDFGFVVTAGAPATPAGSPRFLPPEAFSAQQPPESIDRYAAALVLHQTLTGDLPILNDDAGDDESAPPPWISERARRVCGVLLQATSPRADDRPTSAVALREAIERAWRITPRLAMLSESKAATVPNEPRAVDGHDSIRADDVGGQGGDRDGGRPVPDIADDGVRQINVWVDQIRGLYRASVTGNADNRGLDTELARSTYVPTALDELLLPAVLQDRPPAVFLSGNPGDGKTAFLERVRAALLAQGAVEREADPSGWELELEGHTFRSCYDASEAHAGLSADQQVRRRLHGLDGERPDAGLTVLVAINDGRLAQLRARHEDDMPWLSHALDLAIRDGQMLPNWPWVVDLKRRSFVTLDGQTREGAFDASAERGRPSVFARVLDTLVAPERWTACGVCRARAACPILANAEALRGDADDGRARRCLEDLARLVHLRRGLHTTMRDLRSALAYLLTANLACERVHQTLEGDDDADDVLGPTSRYWQRAFTPPSDADELLRELGRLDPGRLSRPRLDRHLAMVAGDGAADLPPLFPETDRTAAAEATPEAYVTLDGWMAAVKRRLYFHADALEVDDVTVWTERLLPYRHAERFIAALRGDEPLDTLRVELARGITRSDGIAADVLGQSLAVLVQHDETQQLAVVKQFPVETFQLRVVPAGRGVPIESMPEVLELTHRDGSPSLTIELDLFELLLRFAEGTRPTAPEYRPFLEDLAPFKNALNRSSTHELVLLEAERRIHRITQRDGKIVLAQGHDAARERN